MQKFLTLCGGVIGVLLLTVNSSFAQIVTQEEMQKWEKQCKENNAIACSNLAATYLNGLNGKSIKRDYFNAQEDYLKAREYYKKSCDLNYGLGCVDLGRLYYLGQGVKQNYFKANEYYTRACNLNYGDGCTNLGYSYYFGQGVKQDTQKAKEYYGKACDLKEQLGCDNYAKLNK